MDIKRLADSALREASMMPDRIVSASLTKGDIPANPWRMWEPMKVRSRWRALPAITLADYRAAFLD